MPPSTLGEIRHVSCRAMCQTNNPTTIMPGSSHGELSPNDSSPLHPIIGAVADRVGIAAAESQHTRLVHRQKGARKTRQVSGRRVLLQ